MNIWCYIYVRAVDLDNISFQHSVKMIVTNDLSCYVMPFIFPISYDSIIYSFIPIMLVKGARERFIWIWESSAYANLCNGIKSWYLVFPNWAYLGFICAMDTEIFVGRTELCGFAPLLWIDMFATQCAGRLDNELLFAKLTLLKKIEFKHISQPQNILFSWSTAVII